MKGHWDIDEDTIHFECDDPEVGEWVYGYDPRVCKIGENSAKEVRCCLAVCLPKEYWEEQSL